MRNISKLCHSLIIFVEQQCKEMTLPVYHGRAMSNQVDYNQNLPFLTAKTAWPDCDGTSSDTVQVWFTDDKYKYIHQDLKKDKNNCGDFAIGEHATNFAINEDVKNLFQQEIRNYSDSKVVLKAILRSTTNFPLISQCRHALIEMAKYKVVKL